MTTIQLIHEISKSGQKNNKIESVVIQGNDDFTILQAIEYLSTETVQISDWQILTSNNGRTLLVY